MIFLRHPQKHDFYSVSQLAQIFKAHIGFKLIVEICLAASSRSCLRVIIAEYE